MKLAARRKWRRASSDFLSLLALYELEAGEGGGPGVTSGVFENIICIPFVCRRDPRRQLEQMATQALKATPTSCRPLRNPFNGVVDSFWATLVASTNAGYTKGFAMPSLPSSHLGLKKDPKWIVAAEIVETSRRWGRLCAKVQPSIEEAAADRVVRSWDHPEWDAERGEMLAGSVESSRLELYGRRRVALARATTTGPNCSSSMLWWKKGFPVRISWSPIASWCCGYENWKPDADNVTCWQVMLAGTRFTTANSPITWWAPGA